VIEKIVSGGQTGADRAALDWAIAHGLEHGGWCPKGRRSEDGPIDPRYMLQETPSSGYPQRTEWNVRDSDGTVVFTVNPVLTGGSKTTLDFAMKLKKPCFHVCLAGQSSPETELLHFIRSNKVRILNVAGPRASKEPEITSFVREVLDKTLALLSQNQKKHEC